MRKRKIPINELKVVDENEHEILAYCCFHNDTKHPNLIINKTGPYAGRYHCWACGADGWARDLNIKRDFVKAKKSKANVDWNKYLKHTDERYMSYLAMELNIDRDVLVRFGVGYKPSEYCYCIPVFNEGRYIIGIQRRYVDGQKRMVKGSRLGIFMSSSVLQAVRRLKNDFVLLITEGFSDAAVATHFGFYTIGRISATSSTEVITKFIAKYSIPNIILIADNDGAGIVGAEKLVKKLNLSLTNPPGSIIMYPETESKDLRDMYEQYGYDYTKKWIEDRINEYEKY